MSINTTTAYKTRLHVPFGELKNIVEWCQCNMQGDWKFTDEFQLDDVSVNTYEFLFELERDYVAFSIWKT
jgi:hypothetical protein